MLRNREFRRFTLLFSIMAVVAAAIGFAISSAAGILMLIAAAAFGMAFYVFTRARYLRIAQLSHEIDLVLHNADRLELDKQDEGELSILHSEITKMLLRIRQQNDALKKEKMHLADSLADIAHQLRTPLTSAGLILTLLADHPDEQEQKAFVREAEQLLVRMDWLITALLKLSRLDAGVVVFQSKPIDVSALIRDAVRPFLISMELHNVDVRIDVPDGVVIQGDDRWLSEALQNIFKNCLESTGDCGKIEVVGVDTPLFTEISVHDSGPGFAKEDLPQLFDRFYRGKSAGAAGYGVGLALSRVIITRQGGTIAAKNHPRGGAVFFIRFPK